MAQGYDAAILAVGLGGGGRAGDRAAAAQGAARGLLGPARPDADRPLPRPREASWRSSARATTDDMLRRGRRACWPTRRWTWAGSSRTDSRCEQYREAFELAATGGQEAMKVAFVFERE